MKKTLSTYEAANMLRADNNNGFTYSGATALCEYLEELESDTGKEIEFDPVAIRCDFAEFENLRAWANEFFGYDSWREELNIEEEDGDEDIDDEIRRYITGHGTLIEFDGGVIVSTF